LIESNCVPIFIGTDFNGQGRHSPVSEMSKVNLIKKPYIMDLV